MKKFAICAVVCAMVFSTLCACSDNNAEIAETAETAVTTSEETVVVSEESIVEIESTYVEETTCESV